ncbi:hypothetical protein [Phaeocystidibacter luteus]|uniref:DUF3560 domain-containing protein n=1 Tax=Phaeocystidibacter luteus TaxID=911197 RepID=A0A6N6RLX5_9FLAO|nr:hypothetical protein [Phaeocystidibacter luteus]KAB2814560.1 hypothetical protein F8C67_02135 [Phaeocystidibacter luteus]
MKFDITDLKERARRAFDWISFSPEKRGDRFISDYQSILEDRIKALQEAGASDAELETFYKRYRSKVQDVISAKSRTASPMITGPAKFPTDRNNKALDVEMKRHNELHDFIDKALSRFQKGKRKREGYYLPDAELKRLESDLAERKEAHKLMKEVNAVLRSKKDVKKRLLDLGLKDQLIDSLMNPERGNRRGYQQFELSNNLANIKRIEGRVKLLKKKQAAAKSEGGNSVSFDGGEVILNFADDRVQIRFDEIPSADERKKLKSNGFRWSPKNKVWQRKLTRASIHGTNSALSETDLSSKTLNELYFELLHGKSDTKPTEPKPEPAKEPKKEEGVGDQLELFVDGTREEVKEVQKEIEQHFTLTPKQVLEYGHRLNKLRKPNSQIMDALAVNKKRLPLTAEGLFRWAQNPGRYDIPGVDAPASTKPNVTPRVDKKLMEKANNTAGSFWQRIWNG